MKKIVYTAFFGDYDTLNEPEVITPGWEYVCFTDQKIKSQHWKIVGVRPQGYSPAKAARRIKIDMRYQGIHNYEISVWVDASIKIKCDLDGFVKDKLQDAGFSLMKHPTRNNIIQEAHSCKERGKDKVQVINSQVNKYIQEGYTFCNGLVATGILIRRPTKEVIEFCEMWWKEVEKFSHRDQLSFNYVMWKNPINYTLFRFDVLYDKFRLFTHKYGK